MTSRIDRVMLDLFVTDEFEGQRTVAFDYEPESLDDPIIELVRQLWQALYDRRMAKIASVGPEDLLF